MIDEPEVSGGKINWPLAIVVSLVLHFVALGLFWICSRPDESPAPVATEAPSAAPAPEPGGEAELTHAAPPPVTVPPPAAVPPSPPVSTRTTTTVPVPATPATPVEATEIYVVQPGDYLARIAKKSGCTVDDIKRLNGAAAAKTLHPGDKLKVPVKAQ